MENWVDLDVISFSLTIFLYAVTQPESVIWTQLRLHPHPHLLILINKKIQFHLGPRRCEWRRWMEWNASFFVGKLNAARNKLMRKFLNENHIKNYSQCLHSLLEAKESPAFVAGWKEKSWGLKRRRMGENFHITFS